MCVMHHFVRREGKKRVYTYSLLLLLLSSALSASLLLALALLEERLGDKNLLVGGDGTMEMRLVRSPAYRAMVWVERRGENCSYAFSALADSKIKMNLIGEKERLQLVSRRKKSDSCTLIRQSPKNDFRN